MTPTTSILVGHVLDQLASLPDESVDMCWSSPPYWGLRAYQTAPQAWGGNPDCLHRWGDVKAHGKRGKRGISGEGGNFRSRASEAGTASGAGGGGQFCVCGAWYGEHGLEPTVDLWVAHEVAVFRAVRRVLKAHGTLWVNIGDAYCSGTSAARKPTTTTGPDVPAGWAGRSQSVRTAAGNGLKPKDRCMLPARLAIALQGDGWWLRDEIVWRKPNPMPSSVQDRTTPAHEMLYLLSKRPRYYFDREAIQEPATYNGGRGPGVSGWAAGPGAHDNLLFNGAGRKRDSHRLARAGQFDEYTTRNRRSVWDIPTEPYAEAHFATAPTALVEPCVLAGCPKGGVVLDPFGGSGTTALVANRLLRNAILIELNPAYAELARGRLKGALQHVDCVLPETDPHAGLPLFEGLL